MASQSPLRIHLTPSRVRVDPRIENEELVLYFRSVSLSAHEDTLEVHVPDQSALPVTVEFVDFEDDNGTLWTVTANHHGTEWARNEDRCSHDWSETEDDVRVDVTASSNGASIKAKPTFLRVPPEGARPYP